jgi:hypothetical protein
MTLQRLVLDFRSGKLVVRCLYRSKGDSNPATKGRRREVAALTRTGLPQALEVLEAGVDVDMVGTSGFTSHEAILSREIRDLKKRISLVIEGVREGSQDRNRAALAIQRFNALRSVLELERKVKEQEKVLERLEALEQTAKPAKGGSRWGV